MGTAYGISNCVGWYQAGIGCYSDAGTTPAASGAGVYQWNDQSGAGNHLQQTNADDRPVLNTYAASLTTFGAASIGPYGVTASVDQTSYPTSLLFDGVSGYLNLPTTATFTSAGCTVVICSRGSYYCPVCLGNAAGQFVNYGWFGGVPQKMGMQASALNLFPLVSYLPDLVPMVHGFRCSATLNQSRIYLGTNQQTSLPSNLANFSMTAGAIGATPPRSDPNYSYYWFRGEIYELAIFATPLSDAQMATLLQQMQAANGLPANANSSQVVFVGDSLTAGGPGIRPLSHCYAWRLTQQYAGAIKPLLLAVPGQTIANQQTLVTAQVVPLDLTAFAANVAVVCCGSNDAGQGRTAAQISADLVTLCTSLRSAGFKVILATITPRATSGFTSAMSTVLTTVNATLRTSYSSFADALVDWAADPRLSDPTNTQYFADLCHTTDAGDNVKAQLVKAALDPLLAAPAVTLSYANFYAAGESFTGNYGRFVRA